MEMTLDIVQPPKTNSIQYTHDSDMFEKMGVKPIPFQTHLSFAPLIHAIKSKLDSDYPGESYLARTILKKINAVPELAKPIVDMELVENHRPLIEMMLLYVLPPASRMQHMAKVMQPFSMRPIYITPPLQELVSNNDVTFVMQEGMDKMYCAKVIRACLLILNRFYDQKITDDQLISLMVRNRETGLTRYLKTQVDFNFIEIKKVKPLKKLTQAQINKLMSNVYDIKLWLEAIPPENFSFEGFMIGHMIDITEEEALSRIKFQLLGRDAVMGKKNVDKLQDLLRTYFRQPDLRMGITAIDYPLERTVSHRYRIRFDLLAHKHECLLSSANANSIYDKVCRYQEILLIEDLEAHANKTPIEEDMLAEGIRSIIVAPLTNKKDQVIGILEIGSPHPFKLHSFVELKFKEVVDLFAMAVERSRDEVDNRIEAIIREKYTAVHPSVEWKFIENAFHILEQQEDGQSPEPPPIIFENVHPLYGQADIVGSSDTRNEAIQDDMRINLQLARQAVKKCLQYVRYPLLNQVMMKLDKNLKLLDGEFNSSDESRIIELLLFEIHPLLQELSAQNQELAAIIAGYFGRLDPELGIVYQKRKAYEHSVATINRTISKYLDKEQEMMQEVVPHYYEKYKTDGVEYDIYLGQSLLRRKTFNELHLKNFRLWQMIHMCEITRLIDQLQPKLEVPLQTAQLIFAYTNSLSIRFRMDEKQFDVDGAYNVRYEILKKRIDKATVNGTDERLTQAGKVAVVYLHDKDRQEYLEYIEYLQHEGYITDEVEELSINRLQSVQGLKALRVTVRNQLKKEK